MISADFKLIEKDTEESRITPTSCQHTEITKLEDFSERDSEPPGESSFDLVVEYSRGDSLNRRLETIELLNNLIEADFSETGQLLGTIDKILGTEEARKGTVNHRLLETIAE